MFLLNKIIVYQFVVGHHNIITVTGMKIDADDSMRQLDVKERKCIFYDESSSLRIYQNYTYENCIFECSLLEANSNFNCTPWYFPTTDENIKVCNPWEALNFSTYLNTVKSEKCSKCLPECTNTIYQPSIVTIPFRPCDASNMEMSLFCKISNFWSKPFPKTYTSEFDEEKIQPDERINNTRTQGAYQQKYINIFKKTQTWYDAFDVDIAIVDIYFQKSSVIQMGRQSRMTWVDYLSNVGGLMGLVLGMGFVSFIEIFWLGLRLIARSLNLTSWIV